MQTCAIPMGSPASRDYIIQIYNDTDMPYRIAKYFEEIATDNGSSATLDFHSSQVILVVSEVGGVKGWRALYTAAVNREETKYHQWLREAHDKASAD